MCHKRSSRGREWTQSSSARRVRPRAIGVPTIGERGPACTHVDDAGSTGSHERDQRGSGQAARRVWYSSPTLKGVLRLLWLQCGFRSYRRI